MISYEGQVYKDYRGSEHIVIYRATGIGFSPILKKHEISNKYDRKRLNMA